MDETRRNWMVALDVGGLIFCVAGILALGYLKAKHPDAITEGVFAALLTQLSNLAAYFGLSLRDVHAFEFGNSRNAAQQQEAAK